MIADWHPKNIQRENKWSWHMQDAVKKIQIKRNYQQTILESMNYSTEFQIEFWEKSFAFFGSVRLCAVSYSTQFDNRTK